MKTISIGAVSKEAIEAVYYCSDVSLKPLMLSIDKNQVDHNSGYIMNTKDFMFFIRGLEKKYSNAQVALLRTHCGPAFTSKESDLSDTWKTLETDMRAGINFTHLDFFNLKLPRETIHTKVQQAIKYAKHLNPLVKFIAGNTQFRHNQLNEELEFYSKLDIQPIYCTYLAGTTIKDGIQFGKLTQNELDRCFSVASNHAVLLKEDESDFLTPEEIEYRKPYFGCLSIGAELAIAHNELFLKSSRLSGTSLDRYTSDAMKNKNWKKLLGVLHPDDSELCLSLTSHWYFNTQEGIRIASKIEDSSYSEKVIEACSNIIFRYMMNFL